MSVRDSEINGLPKEESFDNSILGNFPVPAEVASAGKASHCFKTTLSLNGTNFMMIPPFNIYSFLLFF